VNVQHPRPAFADDRGTITDLLIDTPVEHVTLISSRAGSVRGNHYHRETTQYLYIIRGRMRLRTRQPAGPVEERIVAEGDLFVNTPGERHAMRALDDTVFMVFTRGPRGGPDFETDTYRLAPDDVLDPA